MPVETGIVVGAAMVVGAGAVLFVVDRQRKAKRLGVEVRDIAYDATKNTVKITLLNQGGKVVKMDQSALRQKIAPSMPQPLPDGTMPMMPASTAGRKQFMLLAESVTPIVVQPNEQRILEYPVPKGQEFSLIDLEYEVNGKQVLLPPPRQAPPPISLGAYVQPPKVPEPQLDDKFMSASNSWDIEELSTPNLSMLEKRKPEVKTETIMPSDTMEHILNLSAEEKAQSKPPIVKPVDVPKEVTPATPHITPEPVSPPKTGKGLAVKGYVAEDIDELMKQAIGPIESQRGAMEFAGPPIKVPPKVVQQPQLQPEITWNGLHEIVLGKEYPVDICGKDFKTKRFIGEVNETTIKGIPFLCITYVKLNGVFTSGVYTSEGWIRRQGRVMLPLSIVDGLTEHNDNEWKLGFV